MKPRTSQVFILNFIISVLLENTLPVTNVSSTIQWCCLQPWEFYLTLNLVAFDEYLFGNNHK